MPSTPAAGIQADLTHCDTGTRPHAELHRSAAGNRESLHTLGDAASWYHRSVPESLWPSVERAGLHGPRGPCAHDLATLGLDRLPANLPSCIRWTPPTLHPHYPIDRDIDLAGRDLTPDCPTESTTVGRPPAVLRRSSTAAALDPGGNEHPLAAASGVEPHPTACSALGRGAI
ncbi:hypothetical protein GCM10009527_096320 [Actinomadura nitritigenes]